MINLTEEIAQADAFEIEKLLKAVLQRYTVLFPDWEIGTIAIQKSTDRNEQLDEMIAVLQKMKTITTKS